MTLTAVPTVGPTGSPAQPVKPTIVSMTAGQSGVTLGEKKSHRNCKHCGQEVQKDMYREWYHIGTRHYMCDLKDKSSKVAESS